MCHLLFCSLIWCYLAIQRGHFVKFTFLHAQYTEDFMILSDVESVEYALEMFSIYHINAIFCRRVGVDKRVEFSPACHQCCIPSCCVQWLHALHTDSGSAMQWKVLQPYRYTQFCCITGVLCETLTDTKILDGHMFIWHCWFRRFTKLHGKSNDTVKFLIHVLMLYSRLIISWETIQWSLATLLDMGAAIHSKYITEERRSQQMQKQAAKDSSISIHPIQTQMLQWVPWWVGHSRMTLSLILVTMLYRRSPAPTTAAP